MAKGKVILIPLGVKFNKKQRFIRFAIFGFEIGFLWKTDWWNCGFNIGLLGHGICFDRDFGFWGYHESLEDFWLAI